MESTNAKFTCPQCGKEFTRRNNLSRHMRTAHRGERFVCDKCTKSFSRNDNLKKHQCALQQGLMEYGCRKCPEVFRSPRELGVHFRRIHSSAATPPSQDHAHPSTSRAPVAAVGAPSSSSSSSSSRPTTEACNCRTCHRHFEDRASLYRHQITEGHRHLPSSQSGGGSSGKTTEPRPWGEGPAPWEDEDSRDEVMEPGLREAYDLNAPFILARDQHGDVLSTFNVPVTNSFGVGELMEPARDMYQSLD